MQGHQQLPPFPAQGVALTDLIGIQAACQLLGEAAAPFDQATAAQIGGKRTQGSDGIHTRVPPEAIVLGAQQGIDQRWREGRNRLQLPVTAGIHRFEGFVQAVVDGDRPLHCGQSSADRHIEHGDEHQSRRGTKARQQPEPQKPFQPAPKVIGKKAYGASRKRQVPGLCRAMLGEGLLHQLEWISR